MTEEEESDRQGLRLIEDVEAAVRGRSEKSSRSADRDDPPESSTETTLHVWPTGNAGTSPALRSLSDQELLGFIQGGSERHFNELYERYFQRIYNFVYARIRNHADAEEIVQETFTAVFRSIDSYRGQSSLHMTLLCIAILIERSTSPNISSA